jgi:peptidoglycan/xylan/chitin deacetylase (PgdA/CDA1 family)
MSIFFIQKQKSKIILLSFFGPFYLLFPAFFSYSFFMPISILEESIYVDREKEIPIEKAIPGIENKIKEEDNIERIEKSIIDRKSSIKILIFGYHQIREIRPTDGPKTKMFITSPEIFEKQMKFLFEKGYRTISTTDYIDYLKTGKADFDLNKSFILTFDDGYASQYINAFPILKKYSFKATFFIYTDCIDKYPACMTSKEVKDLVANGMRIGNHTLHHAYLPKYSDEEIKREIEINKIKIMDIVGISSFENVFAYPYGGRDDRVEDIVKSLDYQGAVGIMASKKEKETNLFNLKRYL